MNADELRDLARSVNEMAARLAQFQEAVGRTERMRLLGQVSGGLAHQLRNAVTGAKLAVQLHAQSCADGDAEALEVALKKAHILVDRRGARVRFGFGLYQDRSMVEDLCQRLSKLAAP